MRNYADSTIYRLALENYATLGHSMVDDVLLKKAASRLSNKLTQTTRAKFGNSARRFTEADAAETLHAIGAWMEERENPKPIQFVPPPEER